MKLARYAKYIFIVLIILAFSLSSVGNTYYPLLNKILQLIAIIWIVLSYFFNFRYFSFHTKRISVILFFLLFVYSLFYITRLDDLYTLIVTFIVPIFLGMYLKSRQDNSQIIYWTFISIIILNFLALANELITGQVLVNISEGYEIYIGGPIYHFGLFSDPKSGGVCIALMTICLPPKYKYVYFIAFIETILSGCRTSTVLLILPILYFVKESSRLSKFVFIGFIVFRFFEIISYLNLDSRVLERLLNVFSFADAGNEDRTFYMQKHFNIWVNHYNLFQYILGDYNYSRKIVGNGAESAILSLLLDCGLIVLLLYMEVLFKKIKKTCDLIDKANYFVLFVLMFVSGLGVGINSGYIFWYLISDGMSAKGNNKIGIGV